MATYSAPIISTAEPKVFRGVVTCDISLEWLSDFLSSLPLSETGHAFILTKNGTFLAHPLHQFNNKETIFSVAQAYSDKRLHHLGESMTQGQSGFAVVSSIVNREDGWLVYVPIPNSGWSLGVFFPEQEIMAKIFELTRKQIGLGLIGFIVLIAIVVAITRSITSPIRQLNQAVRNFSAGSMDDFPEFSGKDEIANLAASYTTMTHEIKVYMEMLKETTAATERIESELRIAHSIQMNLVPKVFPPFPARDDFQLYAVLDPAREVGGDFYDFFLLDEQHLCIVIADVSGKGIPAALFMAVARTLIKSIAEDIASPGGMMERLNNELSKDNDTCMFVTLFCLVVHLPSGQCTFANGGHNLPMLVDHAGNVSKLPQTQGVLIGAMEDMIFAEATFHLQPGDKLFFYTDGVTEAENRMNAFYGENRLMSELGRLKDLDCSGMLTEMRASIAEFADGAVQSDDITMLAFHYKGDSMKKEEIQ